MSPNRFLGKKDYSWTAVERGWKRVITLLQDCGQIEKRELPQEAWIDVSPGGSHGR